jgi:anti-sigma regulatory factor (Ser/Thr protein kinase)
MHQVSSDVGTQVRKQESCATLPGLAVMAETFHWSIPSRPELIEKVVMALKERAESCGICNEERVTGLVISLTEAITNAMVHGNLEISSDVRERTDGEYGRLLATRCADPKYAEREVQVDVHWNGNTCEWTISDHGNGFDVDEVLARLDTDEVSELASGRGILLMRAFMDNVRWSAGGREIRMTMSNQEPTEIGEAARTRVRHAVKAKGFETGETSVDAVATSISTMGVQLVAQGLASAKRLMIELELDGKKTLVPVEVRHATPMAADWVQFDCRFAAEMSSAESASAEEQRAAIDRVLQGTRHAADDGHERRTEERYQYTEVVRIERRGGALCHGMARDLSRGGMAFIGNFELQRGEIITLTLEPETSVPVKVACEVMRVQHLAGVYRDFGVRFLPGAKNGGESFPDL